MARNVVVTGAFATPADAERAKSRLVEAGIPAGGIALSADLADDALAAECPGQTYSNQPGQPSGEDFAAAGADTAHAGGCMLRVELVPDADRGAVEAIMRECGGLPTPTEH